MASRYTPELLQLTAQPAAAERVALAQLPEDSAEGDDGSESRGGNSSAR